MSLCPPLTPATEHRGTSGEPSSRPSGRRPICSARSAGVPQRSSLRWPRGGTWSAARSRRPAWCTTGPAGGPGRRGSSTAHSGREDQECHAAPLCLLVKFCVAPPRSRPLAASIGDSAHATPRRQTPADSLLICGFPSESPANVLTGNPWLRWICRTSIRINIDSAEAARPQRRPAGRGHHVQQASAAVAGEPLVDAGVALAVDVQERTPAVRRAWHGHKETSRRRQPAPRENSGAVV
jgi:hypothetical protein